MTQYKRGPFKKSPTINDLPDSRQQQPINQCLPGAYAKGKISNTPRSVQGRVPKHDPGHGPNKPEQCLGYFINFQQKAPSI